MSGFARFRNEIWCMDLAYVDKLAKEYNGVKYLLFRQDLFDRTVNAKGMKTKDSQETVKAFSSMITKRSRPKKIWVDKGTEFAGAFRKFCAAEGIHVYSTMSETKAAFAERTIRSLKNILYHDYNFLRAATNLDCYASFVVVVPLLDESVHGFHNVRDENV